MSIANPLMFLQATATAPAVTPAAGDPAANPQDRSPDQLLMRALEKSFDLGLAEAQSVMGLSDRQAFVDAVDRLRKEGRVNLFKDSDGLVTLRRAVTP